MKGTMLKYEVYGMITIEQAQQIQKEVAESVEDIEVCFKPATFTAPTGNCANGYIIEVNSPTREFSTCPDGEIVGVQDQISTIICPILHIYPKDFSPSWSAEHDPFKSCGENCRFAFPN